MKQPFRLLLLLLLLPTAAFAAPSATRARARSVRGAAAAAHAPQGIAREKRERNAAQQKIDSQLLYALYRRRGEAEAKGVPAGELLVKFDEQGRALVNVRARVTSTLLAKIKSLGGKVVSSSVRYRDIRARVPLEKLEALAAFKDVYAITPAEEATTNRDATTNR
jgi:hypothetical protein